MSDWQRTEEPSPPESGDLVLYGGVVAPDSAACDIIGRVDGYAEMSGLYLASGSEYGLVMSGSFVVAGMTLALPPAKSFEITIGEKNGLYLRTRKFMIEIVGSRDEVKSRFLWPMAATVD